MCAVDVGLLISKQVFIIEKIRDKVVLFFAVILVANFLSKKRYNVNKRILRFIFANYLSSYHSNQTLHMYEKSAFKIFLCVIFVAITLCPSINLKQPVMVLVVFFTYKLWNALLDFVRTTEFTGFKLENPRPHFVRQHFFLINISLNIMYLLMYLYMLYILVGMYFSLVFLVVNLRSNKVYACMCVSFSRARACIL